MCFPNVKLCPLNDREKSCAIILKVVKNKYHHEDTSMSSLARTPNSHAERGVIQNRPRKVMRNGNSLGQEKLELEPLLSPEDTHEGKGWDTWSYEYCWKAEWEKTTQFLQRHIHAADQGVGGRLKKAFFLATVQICHLAIVLDPKNGNSFRNCLDKALE